MRMPIRDILLLPVRTVSGTRLGRVRNIILDIHTHSVVQYHAAAWLGRPRYLIHPAQVVDINKDEMVVDDAALVSAPSAASELNPKTESVAMRQTE